LLKARRGWVRLARGDVGESRGEDESRCEQREKPRFVYHRGVLDLEQLD
jgi:hypothetical protein